MRKLSQCQNGNSEKLRAICNVPVECDDTCKILPRPPEQSGIIMLKLKRKLQFRGHVYFQGVRPQFIYNALNWLKLNSPLYSNIEINIENINTELMCLEGHNNNVLHSMIGANEDVAKNINRDALESDDDNEEKDDPLNEHRQATSETCLQSVLPDYPISGPKTVFVNTNVPDKRIHVAKSQEELDQLDDDSTDIFKSNVIKRYTIRPVLPIINNLCLLLIITRIIKLILMRQKTVSQMF